MINENNNLSKEIYSVEAFCDTVLVITKDDVRECFDKIKKAIERTDWEDDSDIINIINKFIGDDLK